MKFLYEEAELINLILEEEIITKKKLIKEIKSLETEVEDVENLKNNTIDKIKRLTEKEYEKMVKIIPIDEQTII